MTATPRTVVDTRLARLTRDQLPPRSWLTFRSLLCGFAERPVYAWVHLGPAYDGIQIDQTRPLVASLESLPIQAQPTVQAPFQAPPPPPEDLSTQPATVTTPITMPWTVPHQHATVQVHVIGCVRQPIRMTTGMMEWNAEFQTPMRPTWMSHSLTVRLVHMTSIPVKGVAAELASDRLMGPAAPTLATAHQQHIPISTSDGRAHEPSMVNGGDEWDRSNEVETSLTEPNQWTTSGVNERNVDSVSVAAGTVLSLRSDFDSFPLLPLVDAAVTRGYEIVFAGSCYGSVDGLTKPGFPQLLSLECRMTGDLIEESLQMNHVRRDWHQWTTALLDATAAVGAYGSTREIPTVLAHLIVSYLCFVELVVGFDSCGAGCIGTL